MSSDNRVLLGRIVGAHGIRGEVVIHSFAAVPEDVAAYGALLSADGRRTFRVASARSTSKGVVARIDGVSDRNAAEALKGTELFVPRDRLPATSEGEFYVNDLIGMQVVDEAGTEIGAVVNVPDYGAGALLEIRMKGAAQTELIPFTDAFVPSVDAATRRVTVRPLIYADDDEPDDAGHARPPLPDKAEKT